MKKYSINNEIKNKFELLNELANKLTNEAGLISRGRTFMGKSAKTQQEEFLKSALPLLIKSKSGFDIARIMEIINGAKFMYSFFGAPTPVLHLVQEFASMKGEYLRPQSESKNKDYLNEAYNRLNAELHKNYKRVVANENLMSPWKTWNLDDAGKIRFTAHQPPEKRPLGNQDMIVKKNKIVANLEGEALKIINKNSNFRTLTEIADIKIPREMPSLEKLKKFKENATSLSYVEKQGKVFLSELKKEVITLPDAKDKVISNLENYILNDIKENLDLSFKSLQDVYFNFICKDECSDFISIIYKIEDLPKQLNDLEKIKEITKSLRSEWDGAMSSYNGSKKYEMINNLEKFILFDIEKKLKATFKSLSAAEKAFSGDKIYNNVISILQEVAELKKRMPNMTVNQFKNVINDAMSKWNKTIPILKRTLEESTGKTQAKPKAPQEPLSVRLEKFRASGNPHTLMSSHKLTAQRPAAPASSLLTRLSSYFGR